MLVIRKINKNFGVETILKDVSFVINTGDRIGLIGPNGVGKSTLIKIIIGEEPSDSGSIAAAQDMTIGYLPQGLPMDEDSSVLDVAESGIPEWQAARNRMEAITREMETTSEEDLDSLLDAYSQAAAAFEAAGGYAQEHLVEVILDGLGLPRHMHQRPVSKLSGGQRTRTGLAKVLISEPDLLLLDEPTNHLDIESLEWLESFIHGYTGGVLLASHDRVFLENTVNKIIAINPETRQISEYAGTYSYFETEAERELSNNWQQWKDQEAEIRRLEADIQKTKMQAKSVELTTTSRQPNIRRYAKKVAKKALSREKKLDRYRESEDRVEKPKKGWQMKLSFEESMRSGQSVITIESLSFGYGKSENLLKEISFSLSYGERVALTGRNGSGKTSLLKLINGKLQAREGHIKIGASVRIGYMPQEQEVLPPDETPLSIIQHARAMSETDGRNFLHYFLFEGEDAIRPVGLLSYGERARLILAKMVTEGANFLIMDEPVNHLDIPSRERFEAALEAFPGTILAAVHDRAFIGSFAQRILHLEEGRLLSRLV